MISAIDHLPSAGRFPSCRGLQGTTGWNSYIMTPKGETMKANVVRFLLVLLGTVALTTAYQRTKSSAAMATAANNFLSLLSPEQKAKATFSMDDKERLNWHFVPRERK